MTLSRRTFIGTTGLAGLALSAARCTAQERGEPSEAPPPLDRPAGTPEAVAHNEAFWDRVAAHYRIPPEYTNLEAGYFGVMAASALAEYHRQIDRVNYESSVFARRAFAGEFVAARDRVARYLGADPGEVALTRGATEALQALIAQYNPLRSGDEVLYADLDYGGMQAAMDALAERRGVTVVKMTIPEPATHDNVLAAYVEVLERHPRVRLVLLTHLNNKTGLIIPVKEITAMVRARGADTIVDAAHSFGQCDLTLDDLGADFVGISLHKWLGAPVGAGAMYIKADRLADVDPVSEDDRWADQIGGRINTGTANFATYLTVPAALDFHESVGAAYKAARIRYLRDIWVSAVRNTPGIDILTPDDRELVAAITSFRINGQTGREENQAIVQELFDQHGLFTVLRSGIARGHCVRVTPALYNRPTDTERLASALKAIAAA